MSRPKLKHPGYTLIALLISIIATPALAAEEAKWEIKAQTKGVTVYSRAKPGSNIAELKSVGIVPASPEVVFRVVFDFARYRETMPYTEESTIVGTEDGGKVVHFYSLVNAPVVSKRDYTIRVTDESQWKNGTGYFKTRWTVSNKGPAPKEGVLRVNVNEGSWLIEPVENGTKTRATYYLYTDPGGSIPAWLANKANSSTIPDIFEALGKHALDPRYHNPK